MGNQHVEGRSGGLRNFTGKITNAEAAPDAPGAVRKQFAVLIASSEVANDFGSSVGPIRCVSAATAPWIWGSA
jgi:hypothetical protein